jgi:hypothetical protein
MKQDQYPKKIISYDKHQALRRKSSYRADYWDFIYWCREHALDEAQYIEHPEATAKAEALCKKYGIAFLFNPSENHSEFWGSDFFIEEKRVWRFFTPTNIGTKMKRK